MAEPGPAVVGYLARWAPPSVSPAAAAFARDVMARAGPARRDRAKSLLYPAARLADWAPVTGLDLAAGVLLHPSVIERFAAHSPGLSPPADAPLPRERAKAPTVPRRSAGSSPWPLPSPPRGGGCAPPRWSAWAQAPGWPGIDLREVRGTDMICRSGGVIAVVHGPRPRAVPVLARYHGPLLAAAAFAGERLIIGGRDPARRSLTYPLTAALAGGTGLPRLEGSRLRSTWLRDCAEILGLATFMHAAGITCSQRLGDIIAGLPPGSETGAVALLGGAAR